MVVKDKFVIESGVKASFFVVVEDKFGHLSSRYKVDKFVIVLSKRS